MESKTFVYTVCIRTKNAYGNPINADKISKKIENYISKIFDVCEYDVGEENQDIEWGMSRI